MTLMLAVVGCGPALNDEPTTTPKDAGTPSMARPALNMTGTYRCTIEGVDTTVFCGGVVYLTDLRGNDLPMNVAQNGRQVQIGAFGVTLNGELSDTSLNATYTDYRCTNCSQSPALMRLVALAADGQLRDVRITLSQRDTGYSDCDKEWSGVCVRNSPSQ